MTEQSVQQRLRALEKAVAAAGNVAETALALARAHECVLYLVSLTLTGPFPGPQRFAEELRILVNRYYAASGATPPPPIDQATRAFTENLIALAETMTRPEDVGAQH